MSEGRSIRGRFNLFGGVLLALGLVIFAVISLVSAGKDTSSTFNHMVGWSNILAFILTGSGIAVVVAGAGQIRTQPTRAPFKSSSMNLEETIRSLSQTSKLLLSAHMRRQSETAEFTISVSWRNMEICVQEDGSCSFSTESSGGRGPDKLVEWIEYRDATKSRLVILGGSGAGKTVLLNSIALKLIEKGEARGRQILPLIFPLCEWDPESESFLAWAGERLQLAFPGLALPVNNGFAPASVDVLNAKETIFLLDGLDEVALNLRGKALARIPPDVSLILTCRTPEFLDIIELSAPTSGRYIDLAPIPADLVEEYLTRTAPTKASKDSWRLLLDKENPQSLTLHEALNTPFTLTLARQACRDAPHAFMSELVGLASVSEVKEYLIDTSLARLGDVLGPDQALVGKSSRSGYSRKRFRWATHIAEMMHGLDSKEISWWTLAMTLPQAVRVAGPIVVAFPSFYTASVLMGETKVSSAVVGVIVAGVLGWSLDSEHRRYPRRIAISWPESLIAGLRGGCRTLLGSFLVTGGLLCYLIVLGVAVLLESYAATIGSGWMSKNLFLSILTGLFLAILFVGLPASIFSIATGLRGGLVAGLRSWFVTLKWVIGAGALSAAYFFVAGSDNLRTFAKQLTADRNISESTRQLRSADGVVDQFHVFRAFVEDGYLLSGSIVILFLVVIPLALASHSLVVKFIETPIDLRKAVTPQSALHDDFWATLWRALAGASAVSGVLLVIGSDVLAACLGALLALVVSFVNSAWYMYTYTRLLKGLLGHLPWTPMEFFAELNGLDILKQEGPIYIFRHIEIQRRFYSHSQVPRS